MRWKIFLKWFSDNNWCQYKDGKYYQRGTYRPWRSTKYYTQEELIQLYEKR